MSTLIALKYLMSRAQFKSSGFRKIVSGEAEVPIRDGKPDRRLMKKERITQDGIDSALRGKGIDGMNRVRLGYLEDDGKISALLGDEPTGEQLQSAEAQNKGERSRKKRGVGEI
jgi:uncharacterized membrane protein YcaP (DUF421 family)